jgi:hypothetical protein
VGKRPRGAGGIVAVFGRWGWDPDRGFPFSDVRSKMRVVAWPIARHVLHKSTKNV